MATARQHLVRRAGFTLVEAIATIAVLAALGSVASALVLTSVDGFTRSSTTAQLHSEAAIALERMERELRYIPAAGAGPDISALTTSSITWGADSSLTLNSGQVLLSTDAGAPRILLTDVSQFEIRAFDEANVTLPTSMSGAACEPIRRLAITVTLERNGVSHTLRTRLFLRCMAMNGGGG